MWNDVEYVYLAYMMMEYYGMHINVEQLQQAFYMEIVLNFGRNKMVIKRHDTITAIQKNQFDNYP